MASPTRGDPARGTDRGSEPRLIALYEISQRLERFVGFGESLPRVLDTVRTVLPLASALLFAGDREQFAWYEPALDALHREQVRAHAAAAYAYLVFRSSATEATGDVLARASRPFTVGPIALPLVDDRGRIIGVLQLEPAGAFDINDLLLVDFLAHHLSAALARDRARTVEVSGQLQAQRTARRMRDLRDISDVLLSASSLDAIVPSLLEHVRAMFGTQAAAILMLDRPGGPLRVRGAVGLEYSAAAAVPVGSGVAGRIAAGGRARIVDDLREVADVSPLLTQAGIRSLVGAPLRANGAIVGVIEVCSLATQQFHDEDARLLEIVADNIALGLEHARLFDALSVERGRLRCLLQASLALAGTLDATTGVAALARTLVRSDCDFSFCGVALLSDRGVLERVAVAAADPAGEAALSEILNHLPPPTSTSAVARALRDGGPLLLEGGAAALCGDATASEAAEVTRRLGSGPALLVPLYADGASLGLIAFGTRVSGGWDALDLGLAEELGRRVSTALLNARLHAEAIAAAHSREATLAVVSHDLRNPLSVVRMSAELLLRRPELGLARDAAGRRQAQVILRQTDHMLAIVRDLLDAAKLGRGELPLDEQRVAVVDLLTTVFESFEQVASERGVRLHVDLEVDDVAVRCDRERIVRVLSNLVGNAIKFTREGGRVTLAVERSGDRARFTVRDTGIGIAPDDLEHIFDRFWQAPRTAHLGSGLGLAIAQGIIVAHCGQLVVRSQPGEGSTFEFHLPLEPTAGDAAHP